MLSPSAYLDARFPDLNSVLVTPELFAALKALNEAAHAAMKAATGSPIHHDMMQMRLVTGAYVARAQVSPVVPMECAK